jgi:flavin-binding protein dodecin
LLRPPRHYAKKESPMAIAKVIELSSASPQSFEDAIKKGLERASKTVENIQGIWINEQHAKVENNKITEWRVNMKITFVLND